MDTMNQANQGYDQDDGFGRGRGRGRKPGFRGTAENAKTKICSRWLAGDCRFGDRCNFAHGEEELRALPFQGERGGGRGGRGGPPRGAYGRDHNVDDRGAPDARHPAAFNPQYQPRPQYPPMMGGYGAPPAGDYYGAGPGPVPNGRPAPADERQWAEMGYPVRGNNGWTQYRTPEGETYYHNEATNLTQWDRPADFGPGC